MVRERHPSTRSEEDRRELIVWAVDCCERLLPLFTEAAPDDPRPRAALDGALAFGRGELRIGVARKLAAACHAAARAAPERSAVAVARMCGHATAVAHMGSHARGIPYYTRKALPTDQSEAEDAWQRSRLPPRFTDFVYPDG